MTFKATILISEELKDKFPLEHWEAMIHEAAGVMENNMGSATVFAIFMRPHVALLIETPKEKGLLVSVDTFVKTLAIREEFESDYAQWHNNDARRIMAIEFPSDHEFKIDGSPLL